MSGGQIIEFILLFSSFAYIGVFLLLIISGCGFPLPEELTLLMAGFLTSQAIVHIAPMFFFCFIGAFISDMIPYFAGYFYGPRILASKYVMFVINQRRMRKISLFFRLYGHQKVFLMRPFLLGIRPFIMLFSGISGIKIRTFLPYQLTGMAAGILFWLFLGRLFAAKIELLTSFFYRSRDVIAAAILFVAAIYLVSRFVLNIKIKTVFFIRAVSVIVIFLFLAFMGYEVYIYRSGIKRLIQKAALRGREFKTGRGSVERKEQ